LWMPLLNYAQSYDGLVQRTLAITGTQDCIEVANLGTSQIAALQWYGHLRLQAQGAGGHCPWLLSEPGAQMDVSEWVDTTVWVPHLLVRHPVESGESLWILRRR